MKEFCVDLEIARELKENGFPQNNDYYWYKNNDWFISRPNYDDAFEDKMRYYSAPTSDEILKELPNTIEWIGEYTIIDYDLVIEKTKNGYEVSYSESNSLHIEFSEKSSNALAKMWLYLKKEGYIK